MFTELDALIEATKTEKATKLYEANLAIYGDEAAYLRSLDCRNRQEAIGMLRVVQTYSVRRIDGVIRVF